MPPFRARWLEVARAQYDALPADRQQLVDARLAELLDHPEGSAEAYDQASDQWITTYGDGAGLILYAVEPTYRHVLVLRIL
jgi:hypothetical protein